MKRASHVIAGVGEVHMDASLARKYPNAPREWPWQFIFPAAKLRAHPRTKKYARYHLLEDSLPRRLKHAVSQAALSKRVTCHTSEPGHRITVAIVASRGPGR